MKDGSLETFHEPVGPRVLGFGPGMADAEFLARSVEGSSVLTATIGEDPLERPACLLIERHQDLAEEASRLCGRGSGNDPSRGVGAGDITGRELPYLADALEFADVEAVQADELTRFPGLDVALAAACLLELPAGPLGEQARLARTVALESREAFPPCPKARATERTVDGAGSDVPSSPEQLIRDPLGTGSGPGERHGQDGPLVLAVECRGTATAWRASPGMESVTTIPLCIPLPPVEERSGDTQLAARG
jgi:hypothetical protein